jgi:DNA-binding transcriptional ArsR family regulator
MATPEADPADRPGLNLPNAASVFAALGDETRLQLVSRLGTDGPLSIVRLTAGTDVTRQAITKHLNVLADAGLARSMRHGRELRWQLQADSLASAKKYLDEVSQSWDQALDRLRQFVEDVPA